MKPQKEALISSSILLNGLYRTMFNCLIIHDNNKIYDANDNLLNLTDYSFEELITLPLEKLFLPHESIFLLKDDILTYSSILFDKSNNKIPIEVRTSVLKENNNKFFLSVIRDSREKKAIETELQTERTQRIRAIFDGQEIERKRLAKEIHDGLGQTLIAIRLFFEGKIASKFEQNDEHIEKIRQLIDKAIADARLLSNSLHPSVLVEFGFVTALRQLCDYIRIHSNINLNFQADCSKFALNSLQSSYLFRISQEALNNILKHSNAKNIEVIVSQTEKELTLQIKDDGCGFDTSLIDKTRGNGFFNMRERTQLMQGKFEVKSTIGKGTEIIVKVPNWRFIV